MLSFMNVILSADVSDIMIWVWLFVFVAAFIIEATTQELVSIWFGLGALVTMCITGFSTWWVQLIVFVLVSLISLICTRSLFKKLMARSERYTNSDEIIGKFYRLLKDVSEFEAGEIKINGVIYTAILEESNKNTIKANSVVEVVAFKGNKVIVKEI